MNLCLPIIPLFHLVVGEVYPSFHLFPSSNYLAQEFMCNGTEFSLGQCGYNAPTDPECFVGNRSAAVFCRQGSIQLINNTFTFMLLYLVYSSVS